MAWAWSHTGEAYAAAEQNLRELPRETLLEIAAEWRARTGDGPDDFSVQAYGTALRDLSELPLDVLADDVWERASDAARCDNGGWNAWMCPYGCGPHCVPFSREVAA